MTDSLLQLELGPPGHGHPALKAVSSCASWAALAGAGTEWDRDHAVLKDWAQAVEKKYLWEVSTKVLG